MKKKEQPEKISKKPVLIHTNGRVYIGCDLHNQRVEISICEHRKCRRRRKCPQYQEALKMKEDWTDLYGLLPAHPIVTSTKRRRKSSEISAQIEVPKKRRRKSTTEITTKRRRKQKEIVEKKRKRKRRT